MDDQTYCEICLRGAHDDHLISPKHVWWQRMWEIGYKIRTSGTAQDIAWTGRAFDVLQTLDHPKANWYKWDDVGKRMMCELCHKVADESHVASQQHSRNVQQEELRAMAETSSASTSNGGTPASKPAVRLPPPLHPNDECAGL